MNHVWKIQHRTDTAMEYFLSKDFGLKVITVDSWLLMRRAKGSYLAQRRVYMSRWLDQISSIYVVTMPFGFTCDTKLDR